MKSYYHIIEQNGYDVAWRGCYETYQEAVEEIDRLRWIFLDPVEFCIFESADASEPPITTV